ncbi:MAG: hypothetical protein U0P45_06055 [Acidimicrobiales bacterium]
MTDTSERTCEGGPESLLDELRTLGTVGQAWTIGVVALCALRAVVVWPMLDRYGVDPWWFLVLDVGTAPFYGLGQAMGVKLLRDETRPVRAAMPWITMVVVSFLAPYLYVLRAAGHLPHYVVYGVLLWMAVFGTLAGKRMAREVRCDGDVTDVADIAV